MPPSFLLWGLQALGGGTEMVTDPVDHSVSINGVSHFVLLLPQIVLVVEVIQVGEIL